MLVEIILLISSILFCTVSIYRARVGIRKAIQQRMLDIANCASGSINGDVLKDLKEEDVGNGVYQNLYNTLAVFRDNVECDYIYSIKKEGEGNFIFTMDLDQVSPASYGDSVKYTDALNRAGNGVAAVDETPYSDAWGEFYSAYSPVFDSSGNIAGIIAVDFSTEWFEDQLSAQTRSTVVSYIIILLFSLLVAAVISLFTVRPFVRLQGQLLEEKVRAESANHAKSEFLANMSHEIRTPINAVLGMNEMILREDHRAREISGDSDVGEALENIGMYAEDVKRAGNNLLAIVNDILDFSKIEEGRMDIVETPYRLSSLLGDLNNMILFKAREKGLEFDIDIDPSIPDDLCGDEVRIRQIFTNILTNAVKYTEKGSVKMTVRRENADDGMMMLTAAVEDTGIGIRPGDLEKLFTKFERLELEHNSTVEGTGLGLVITKRLIDAMGGTITATSTYGKGSVFSVAIPQKILSGRPVGDLAARLGSGMQKKNGYHESFRAPSARILIVDDTKTNLIIVTSLLKSTMIQMDTATSGAEAVRMAKDTFYDVILMDQRMPEMDGTEAMHRIRETIGGASSASPVICLTADAVFGAKERYLAQGFSDYMTKPVDSSALENMLIGFLPGDKIERTEKAEDTVNAQNGSGIPEDIRFDGLSGSGIDHLMGLGYCRGDASLYRSILSEYVHSGKEKELNLQKSFDMANWKDYAVYVHSLKSASKMIGALELSEQAAMLEAAANSEDVATILSEHGNMMEKHKAVAQAIISVIPEAATAVEEADILEFAPDQNQPL